MTPERSCTPKNSYDTEWEAKTMAAFRREETGHENITQYKCRFCNHWHIGHSDKPHSTLPIRCSECGMLVARRKFKAHFERNHA